MGVGPASTLLASQGKVQCIGKSKDFLYSGTGLRNAENSSAPQSNYRIGLPGSQRLMKLLMMCEGRIHVLFLFHHLSFVSHLLHCLATIPVPSVI